MECFDIYIEQEKDTDSENECCCKYNKMQGILQSFNCELFKQDTKINKHDKSPLKTTKSALLLNGCWQNRIRHDSS